MSTATATAKVNPAELLAEIEKLKAQLAAKNKLSLKVSDKGAVSIYGLQRFPITLYRDQWKRLLDHAEVIRTFMADNDAKLVSKGDK